MDSLTACRCCMKRPRDKDLRTPYICDGISEVYADMLKECFEINMPSESSADNNGICEVCISRLRDACEFKHQVLHCQNNFQLIFTVIDHVKDEDTPNVKQEELSNTEDSGVIIIKLKREKNYNDDFGDDVVSENESIEESPKRKKQQRTRKSKRRIVIEKPDISTNADKYKKLPKLEKQNKPSLRFLSENKKHSINIDNVLKYSNCVPFSHKSLSGIDCAYCKETYKTIDELRTHAQIHKNQSLNHNRKLDRNKLSVKMDITDLKCTICDKSFDFIANLKKHLSAKHDIKFYSNVHDYILEFKLTEGETLDCALCALKFETFKTLLQHMTGHYRNYVCDVCDMGFINMNKLKNHQRTHESGAYECEHCDKVFTTEVRKVSHVKYVHNKSAKYKTSCPHCEKTFTSYYNRNKHMVEEHNVSATTYKCNSCEKSFILKYLLTTHIKKVHLMERNHVCNECGQSFFRRQSLDLHMVSHTGEKSFKCELCHKAYGRKKTLREHMRIHNNERRFKCDICELAFVQKSSLKSHMSSNHGITLQEYENSKNENKIS